jgi:hypothetical protein
MWEVVPIPSHQSGVAGVFKKEFQRWRFNVTIAKHHVGFALMSVLRSQGAARQVSV